MTTSLLGDAFAHHIWATEELIDACAALTPNQLETAVPGTYGSIIGTLRHLVSSDGWYLSFFGGDPAGRIREQDATSLAELRAAITANGMGWSRALAGEIDPDAEIIEREDGAELHSPLGVRLAQVVHHGTDHRSQVCTALTNLGLTPPEIDLWAFARATGRERLVPSPVPPGRS
jgi:uncharacterized damage-inducible protein DinB